jgi:hypothetical protein
MRCEAYGPGKGTQWRQYAQQFYASARPPTYRGYLFYISRAVAWRLLSPVNKQTPEPKEPVGRRCVATQGVGLRTRTDKGPRIRWRASRGLAPRERASVMRAATRGAGHQGPDARRQDRSFGWDAQGARVAAVRIATHFSSSSPFFFSFPCKFVRDSPILA